jgi:hypothetical protein
MWFAVFPTVETLVGQALAAFLVVGSFFIAGSNAADKALLPPSFLSRKETL